jgi:hypothetical protein
MEINFTNCDFIDKKLYERCILNYIYQHYSDWKTNYQKYLDQDQWKIEIINLNDFDIKDYGDRYMDISTGIPHGVTGMNVVKCYIIDDKNDMFTIQNFSVICHELAHMVLKIYYPTKRGMLRHGDFYAKKGDIKNFFSQEVHDRVKERNLRTVTVYRNRFRKFRFIGVNILDLCV